MISEDQFTAHLNNLYLLIKEACHFSAKTFQKMVNTYGGVEAARRLIANPNPAQGLMEIAVCQRLDLSVEAQILQTPWSELFTDAEKDMARRKLKSLGYVAN